MINLIKARLLDRLIGNPLILILQIFSKLRRLLLRPIGEPKKILIIKLMGIGSIILMSPVFKALKKKYPNAKIVLLTLYMNKGLYDDIEYLDNIYYFSITNLFNFITRSIKLFIWAFSQHFTYVFDFEIASKLTAIFSFIIIPQRSIGYTPAGSWKNVFDINIQYNEATHISKIFLRPLYELGIPIEDKNLISPMFNQEVKDKVKNFLLKNNIKDYICINPNTGDLIPERQWPLEHFKSLIIMIEKYKKIPIILIGAKGDIRQNETLIKLIPRVYKRYIFNSAGIFNIKGSAFLLKKSKLFITNDSGPLHLGIASGARVIGLFGPESPVIYGGFNKKSISLTADIICSPCVTIYRNKIVNCNKNALCMKLITPEKVFNNIKPYIK